MPQVTIARSAFLSAGVAVVLAISSLTIAPAAADDDAANDAAPVAASIPAADGPDEEVETPIQAPDDAAGSAAPEEPLVEPSAIPPTGQPPVDPVAESAELGVDLPPTGTVADSIESVAPIENATATPEAMRTVSAMPMSDGDPAPPSYPVNLPPGYSRAPFTVQYFGGFPGYPTVCVLIGEQYAVEIFQHPGETSRSGVFRISDPGQPDWAPERVLPSQFRGIDLGGDFCYAVSSAHPRGSQFIWPPRCEPVNSFECELALAHALAQQVTVWSNGSNLPPTASFTWEVTDLDAREVTFTNTTTDDGDIGLVRFEWAFGDGSEPSIAPSPVHEFPGLGAFQVSLTATDASGASRTVIHTVTIGSGLLVNSTGDAPAEDPAAGCDTGGTVGTDDAPECTLRAAIEAANAAGGGEIGFDIEGSPVIVLESALPAITTSTTVDGTTQAGGWVEVVGGGAATIELGAGTSRVTGLALHGADRAVSLTGGDGHIVEGTRLGLDLDATATADTATGILVTDASPNAVLRDNTIAATSGILAADAPLAQLSGNRIGVDGSGAALGAPDYGIQLLNAPTSVTDNTVRAASIGIAVVSEGGAAGEIVGNRVGTNGTAQFPDAGTGIVVEGAIGTSIADNAVHAGGWGGILIAGSIQVSIPGDGTIEYAPRALLPAFDAPETSTGVTVTGNRVTTSTGAVAIGSWAGADAIEVTGNTLTVTESRPGVHLIDGEDHRVAGNTIGTDEGVAPEVGVWLQGTIAPVVEDNGIRATGVGVLIDGDGAGADVVDNVITIEGDAPNSHGVEVGWDRSDVTIARNIVSGASHNGIQAEVTESTVEGNEVTGSGHGIAVAGEGVVIRDNLIGLSVGRSDVIGNLGNGISVQSGRVEIRSNSIAGSGGDAIRINPSVVATIRGNRIWDTSGAPINGPLTAPVLEAAIVADSDSTMRTTLLVTGLPAQQDGTIEVFANDSCAADGEARYVPGILRTTTDGRTVMIIQVTGTSDHFTLTYTAPDGATSELSGCRSRAVHPDADGDGSPNPLDDLMGAASEPSIAVLATTLEQLMVVVASDGAIERLGVVADPDPAAHPAGWSLPYGTMSFRVAGLEPGGRTTVVLTTYSQDDPLAGNQYWKYGVQAPGGSPGWYPFGFDAATQTGASRSSADVPGLGFRTVYTLQFADGARGDDDGAMNGSISDPGGPVAFGGPPTSTPVIPLVNGLDGDRSALSDTGSVAAGEPSGIWFAILAVLLGAVMVRSAGWSGRPRPSESGRAPK